MDESAKRIPSRVWDGHTEKLWCYILYPNIHVLLKIRCTLPVTSAVPRMRDPLSSTLKWYKTYLRNTVGIERDSSLALIIVHYSRTLGVDAIIDTFATHHPLRILFADVLSDR